jgi:excisionase family DNA binding protein
MSLDIRARPRRSATSTSVWAPERHQLPVITVGTRHRRQRFARRIATATTPNPNSPCPLQKERTKDDPPGGQHHEPRRAPTYSVDEVAELLGIARGVAYECVRNGSIPATRVGRRWLVPRKRFHAWLEGAGTASTAGRGNA